MPSHTRRSLLSYFATAAAAAPMLALTNQMEAAPGTSGTLAFIGVYTDQGSKSKGIYAYRWNAETGELRALGLAAATPNPSFLAVSPDKRMLYAANEIDNYKGAKDGAVSSFAVDAGSGRLALKNVVSSGGAGPCNINLDHKGESVFVANYTGGSAASFKAGGDGSLSGPVANPRYTGQGTDKARQEGPHAHCATVSPDNRFMLINDLGLDRIHVYKLDAASGKMTLNDPAAYEAKADSGPRSFVFHPNGRVAYSTNELSNTVDVLAWDAAKGVLTRIQNISSLRAEFQRSGNTVASVNVDREGRFVYVSNRGSDNTIVVFGVEPGTGKLHFVQSMESGGKIPRHFAIDPSGKWIVVAHQGSHTLVVFARDSKTGRLTATGRVYPIDWPTCVLFA